MSHKVILERGLSTEMTQVSDGGTSTSRIEKDQKRNKCDPKTSRGLTNINLGMGSNSKWTILKKRKILRDTSIGFDEEEKTFCPSGSGTVQVVKSS
jgi:hypothetical protein